MSDKIEIADVRRLSVQPGDRVLLKVDFPLSAETAERIHSFWSAFAPDVPIFILDSTMTLDILPRAA